MPLRPIAGRTRRAVVWLRSAALPAAFTLLLAAGTLLAGCSLPSRPSPQAAQIQRPSQAVSQLLPQLLALNFVDADDGWARTQDRCLEKTTDGGASWIDVTPLALVSTTEHVDCWTLTIDAKRAWIVTLTPDHKATVYRSADGGLTWAASDPIAIKFGDGGVRFSYHSGKAMWLEILSAGMGALPGELFKSTDAGASWTKVSGTDLDTPGRLPFGGDVSFRDADVGWLTGAPRAAGGPDERVWLFRSADGGASWQHQPIELPSDAGDAPIGVAEPTFFGKNRAVLPVNVIGVGTTLYTTDDGGDTWQITGRQPTWGAPQFVSAEIGWLTDGVHLYRTQDGGGSWQERAPDAALQALLVDHRIETIDFVSAERGWLLLRPRPETDVKSLLLKTTDGGVSWASL